MRRLWLELRNSRQCRARPRASRLPLMNYVNGYACLNGIKNGTSTLCTAGASHNGYADNIVFTTRDRHQVSVGIQRSVPYFFGKMIGLQEAGVAANATAAITATGTVPSGLFPDRTSMHRAVQS